MIENRAFEHGRLAVALRPEALDRVEPELHHLVAVDRVRVGIRRAVLGLVRGEERLATRIRGQVPCRDRALDQRVNRGRDAALGRGRVGVRADTIAAEDLGLGERRVDVLGDLDGAIGGNAGEVEAVGSLALDRRRVGAEVGRVRVDPGVAHDRDPVEALLQLEQRRQAGHRTPPCHWRWRPSCSRPLHRDQAGGGLDRVDRHDPQVGAGSARVVLLRLAGALPGRLVVRPT